MRILVSGSAGFLGTNLLSIISKVYPNWELTGIDIKKPQQRFYNFIHFDISSSFLNWKNLFKKIEPNIIFHLAGVYHSDDLITLLKVNSISLLGILESLRQTNTDPLLIIIGSAAEYGLVNIEDNPINEKHLLRPNSFYGLTKKWQEEIALYYKQTYGNKVICTRPSNFIGRGIFSKLLPGYLNHVFSSSFNEVVVSVNSLKEVRDFIDVRDVCYALLSLSKNPQLSGEVFNISSQMGTSIFDLIEKYAILSNKKVIIKETCNKDPQVIWLSNKKIKTTTGWKPKYTLDDSIEWSLKV